MTKEAINQIKEIITSPIFTINQTPISILSIFVFFLIIFGFILFAKFLKNKILKNILNKFNIDHGLQFTLLRLTQYTIVFIGLVVALQFVGINLSGLAVILGFLSVGIGFGLQNITSNFVAGLILLFERPIKVGDRVTVGNTEGDVININIRSTTIQTLNNISIIVPNEQFISQPVINWSYGDTKIRVDIEVGVSYNSDLDKVIKALKEVAAENPEVLKTPPPDVLLSEFADSSWNMKLRIWINDPKRHYIVRSDINCAIVRKFKEYGIEIPFPQRDLHLRTTVAVPTKNL
ncbi:mechanosensitive ion channel family protein [Melioribacteraceae bacterium 4301-Me]|uniref:mechanosensitive ion channel family protein n=1 Tax=Pyranulibacter aquaticus TaxID=3163344 RepID=UPI003596ACDA